MKLETFIKECPPNCTIEMSYAFVDAKGIWRRKKLTVKEGVATQFSTDILGAYYQLTRKSAMWQWQFSRNSVLRDIFGNHMISLSATYAIKENQHETSDDAVLG